METVIKTERVVFHTSIMSSYKDTNIGNLEDVPVGNKAAYSVLFREGEVDTFLNSMMLGEDHPAKPDPYTDFIMTTEWAESFAAAINATPKPMFIGGHAEYGVSAKERPIPDGYLVGAKVINDTLYLRNALPSEGPEHKKALIEQTKREMKAGMLSTSISDIMEYKIVQDEETYKSTYFATKSLKGQSNAIVEADMTGSDADIIFTSFKGESHKPDSALDDGKRGENRMSEKDGFTNKEMYTSLRNQLDSGRLALSDVATELGIDLMTSKQKTALKRLNEAESAVGPIDEYLTVQKTVQEEAFKSLRKAAIEKTFKSDALVEIATPLFSLKSGSAAEVDAEVERVSGLQLFKTLQGSKLEGMNYNPGEGDSGEVTKSSTMEG